jgi:hypothetical protein
MSFPAFGWERVIIMDNEEKCGSSLMDERPPIDPHWYTNCPRGHQLPLADTLKSADGKLYLKCRACTEQIQLYSLLEPPQPGKVSLDSSPHLHVDQRPSSAQDHCPTCLSGDKKRLLAPCCHYGTLDVWHFPYGKYGSCQPAKVKRRDEVEP